MLQFCYINLYQALYIKSSLKQRILNYFAQELNLETSDFNYNRIISVYLCRQEVRYLSKLPFPSCLVQFSEFCWRTKCSRNYFPTNAHKNRKCSTFILQIFQVSTMSYTETTFSSIPCCQIYKSRYFKVSQSYEAFPN